MRTHLRFPPTRSIRCPFISFPSISTIVSWHRDTNGLMYGWNILKQRETSWREIESRERETEKAEKRARAGRCGFEFQIITTWLAAWLLLPMKESKDQPDRMNLFLDSNSHTTTSQLAGRTDGRTDGKSRLIERTTSGSRQSWLDAFLSSADDPWLIPSTVDPPSLTIQYNTIMTTVIG